MKGGNGRPGLQQRLNALERELGSVMRVADDARMSNDEWRTGHERLDATNWDLRRQNEAVIQRCFEHEESLRAWRERDDRRRERRKSRMGRTFNISKYMARVMG